jgi:transposase-like protein
MTNEMVPHGEDMGEILRGPDGDFLRQATREMLHEIIEDEVAARIGAGRYERSADRVTHRNGTRSRTLETRLGEIEFEIPKLRQGSYFPSFLEPRRRVEKALVSVVQEAYIHGVSTRKVDALVKALGGSGIDKSKVSRLCAELDEKAEAFRNRAIEEEIIYLWLDAVYERVREGEHVRKKAVVLAIGVTADGRRTVLGIDVGAAETEAFWTQFLRSLLRRGLSGVKLVISDAHEGLKKALKVLDGASWQRCRVHTLRSILTHVAKSQQAMVMAALKTIFVQSSRADAVRQLEEVGRALKKKSPKAAELLLEASEDVLAYMNFPSEHWRQLHSTNPLERLIKEIRRRTRVVGIFPHAKSLIRLVAMLLSEQDDEWQAAEKAYFSQTSMAKVTSSISPPPGLMKEVATG